MQVHKLTLFMSFYPLQQERPANNYDQRATNKNFNLQWVFFRGFRYSLEQSFPEIGLGPTGGLQQGILFGVPNKQKTKEEILQI